MNHEADRNQIVVEVIEKRAAPGRIVERPAERVLDEPRLVLVRRYLPELLQAQAELLRLAPVSETMFCNQLLRQIAPRAFGKQRVLGAQLHAAGEIAARLAVLADAHIAGGDARHRTTVIGEHFGGGKARVDLDAERLGLGGKPAADVA